MISKGLSIGILLGSMTLKVPQINTMFQKRTAQGVNLSAELSDLFVYLLGVGYNFHYGNAFSTYGENVFLMLQTLAVIYGLAVYGTLGMPKFIFIVGVTGALMFTYLANLIPEGVYKYNMFILIAISKYLTYLMNLVFYGRISQIASNFRDKNVGVQKALANFMKVGGNAARVFSTYVETDDKLNLLMQITSFIMNAIVLGQVLLYPGVEEKGKKVNEAAEPKKAKSGRVKP